jgi:hypothetical protein
MNSKSNADPLMEGVHLLLKKNECKRNAASLIKMNIITMIAISLRKIGYTDNFIKDNYLYHAAEFS